MVVGWLTPNYNHLYNTNKYNLCTVYKESKPHEIYEKLPIHKITLTCKANIGFFHRNPPDCFSTPLKTVFGLTNTPLQNT